MTTPLNPFPTNPNWPADWQGSRLTGRFMDVLGTPCKGAITFTPTPKAVLSSGYNTIILPAVRRVELDADGAFDVVLPATNDPDLNPTGWTYTVTEAVPGGRTYSIEAPLNATQDLSDLAPVAASEGSAIIRGERGTSAYGTAVQNGYLGNEEQWLASLIGPPGGTIPSVHLTPATHAVANVPVGASYDFVGTAEGYPANGVMLSIKYNVNYTSQTLHARDTNETWTRTGRDDIGWGGWKRSVTTDGATFTGPISAPSVSVNIANNKPATDGPGTYPLGFSSFYTTTSLVGYPAANAVVVTHSAFTSGTRVTQTVTETTTARQWVRSGLSGVNDTWGAWSQVASIVDTPPLWVPASSFSATTGSPNFLNMAASHWAGWYLDPNLSEYMAATVRVPPGWSTVAVDLWWANPGTGTGDVTWDFRLGSAVGGDALGTFSTAPLTATAGTEKQAMVTTVRSPMTINASGIQSVYGARQGASATDTLPTDVVLLGVELRRLT